MTLQEALSVIKKGKFVLIIIPLVALVFTLIFSLYIAKPTYQATTTLILANINNETSNTTLNYDTVLLNKQLIKTYQELAMNPTIMKKLANTLSNKVSIDELRKMVEIELVGETGLIRVKVENSNPREAASIANNMSQIMVVEIPRLLKINNIEIVNLAEVPEQPFKPDVLMNLLIALIVGLTAAMAIVFIFSYFDNTIQTINDIENHLALSNLGTIPKVDNKLGLIILDHPRSVAAESFRTLRSNIIFAGIDKPIEVLLVTSSVAHEGKSNICANLGIAFAQKGNKVIIIDADLRLPTQHELFTLLQMKGLTNVLINNSPLAESLQSSWIPGLKILTTGPLPPNPAELLGSEKMKGVIDEAKNLADIVIIDTAPVIPVTDAAVLANFVDAALLVVKSGKSKTENSQMAVEQMKKAKAKVIGTVLNGVVERQRKEYYSYYYSEKKIPVNESFY